MLLSRDSTVTIYITAHDRVRGGLSSALRFALIARCAVSAAGFLFGRTECHAFGEEWIWISPSSADCFPRIIQDRNRGEVLMLASMNAEPMRDQSSAK